MIKDLIGRFLILGLILPCCLCLRMARHLQLHRLSMTSHSQKNSYVILSNLQSGSNIGSICRNALAFNVTEVIVVGKKSFKDKMRQADRGARSRLNFRQFSSHIEAEKYLRDEKHCKIYGIEIMESAKPLHKVLFTSPSAFIFGNEGGGLSPRQREICDEFVYIPQYGDGMASINVACVSAGEPA